MAVVGSLPRNALLGDSEGFSRRQVPHVGAGLQQEWPVPLRGRCRDAEEHARAGGRRFRRRPVSPLRLLAALCPVSAEGPPVYAVHHRSHRELVAIRVSEREMHRVDGFLARFKGPEVDACRPSGPAASSNRGCRIQLLATRRDQTLEHGAGKYRIQVTNNVCAVYFDACRFLLLRLWWDS